MPVRQASFQDSGRQAPDDIQHGLHEGLFCAHAVDRDYRYGVLADSLLVDKDSTEAIHKQGGPSIKGPPFL